MYCLLTQIRHHSNYDGKIVPMFLWRSSQMLFIVDFSFVTLIINNIYFMPWQVQYQQGDNHYKISCSQYCTNVIAN